MLPAAGRKSLRALIEQRDGFATKLSENEIDDLNIHEVCIDRALFPAENEDVDLEDWEEDQEQEEDFDEEPVQQVIAPVKPGRNDPCWCGSGKKYKKCHLATDEESERASR